MKSFAIAFYSTHNVMLTLNKPTLALTFSKLAGLINEKHIRKTS